MNEKKKSQPRHPRKRFLSIVNWDQMAPKHGNRNFPWCRFYLVGSRESPLNDRQYMELSKSQQRDYWHLVMLADRYNNMVPDDAEQIMFLLHEKEPIDTQALVTAGLVCRRVAGRAAANVRQDATTGKEEVRLGEDLGKDQGRGDIASPQAAPRVPEEPLFFIRLKDRPEPYGITENLLCVYERRFPGVDVRQQIKKFAEVVAASPDRQPMIQALDASINGWLQQAASFNGRGPIFTTLRIAR